MACNKSTSLSSGTGTYQWSNTTVKSVTQTQWKVSSGTVSHTVSMMVTPRVKVSKISQNGMYYDGY
jgi:hypothetical protein